MRWDLLAVFGLVFGFLLVIKGFDTLTEWRAWFFGITGLVLFLLGLIRIGFRIGHIRTRDGQTADKG
jgi:hypothetical protein